MEKFQPDSRRRNSAEPTDWKPESTVASVGAQVWVEARKYCTWKRMYIFSAFLPEPGIEARMPIVSGCFSVSQMLMVAQSSGDWSTVGPVVAAPAARGRAAPRTTRAARPQATA